MPMFLEYHAPSQNKVSCSDLTDDNYRKGAKMQRYQNLTPQSITEKTVEVYLDEWFVITPYATGLLHPAIF